MQFKIGDKVRLTRQGIKEIYGIWTNHNPVLIQGWVIEKIDGNLISIDWTKKLIHKDHFELVPEEPEFKYWEEIEVRDEIGGERKRVIFLCKTTANDTHQYITADISKKSFDNGASFHNNSWRFARKAPPRLSRKEIAEKFWVSEDFILID